MKILASTRRNTKRPHVPHVKAIRETVAGPAAVFDWGSPLPQMSLSRIAALPEPEWARPAYTSRHRLPLGWLRTVDMVAVASSRATVAENLAAIAEEVHGPAGTAAQMLLTAHVARLAAELSAEATTTYDHRPIGVTVGRELGTDAPNGRLWPDEDFGPTAGPLAAEATAQNALRARIFGTEAAR